MTNPGIISALFWLIPMLATAGTPTVTYGTNFGSTGDINYASAVAWDLPAKSSWWAAQRLKHWREPHTRFSRRKQRGFPDNRDVFIAKFDPSGTTLMWASFLGGDDSGKQQILGGAKCIR